MNWPKLFPLIIHIWISCRSAWLGLGLTGEWWHLSVKEGIFFLSKSPNFWPHRSFEILIFLLSRVGNWSMLDLIGWPSLLEPDELVFSPIHWNFAPPTADLVWQEYAKLLLIWFSWTVPMQQHYLNYFPVLLHYCQVAPESWASTVALWKSWWHPRLKAILKWTTLTLETCSLRIFAKHVIFASGLPNQLSKRMEIQTILWTGQGTQTDEFSVKFQTAFDSKYWFSST